MPSLDEMFGKPKTQDVPTPTDILPDVAAAPPSADRTGGGRDVLLAERPFTPEAMEFFNGDQREVEIDVPAATPLPFPGLPSDFGADPTLTSAPAIDQTAVERGVNPLTELLGPSLDNLARFGEFGGGTPDLAQVNISELRELLRKVLKNL